MSKLFKKEEPKVEVVEEKRGFFNSFKKEEPPVIEKKKSFFDNFKKEEPKVEVAEEKKTHNFKETMHKIGDGINTTAEHATNVIQTAGALANAASSVVELADATVEMAKATVDVTKRTVNNIKNAKDPEKTKAKKETKNYKKLLNSIEKEYKINHKKFTDKAYGELIAKAFILKFKDELEYALKSENVNKLHEIHVMYMNLLTCMDKVNNNNKSYEFMRDWYFEMFKEELKKLN